MARYISCCFVSEREQGTKFLLALSAEDIWTALAISIFSLSPLGSESIIDGSWVLFLLHVMQMAFAPLQASNYSRVIIAVMTLVLIGSQVAGAILTEAHSIARALRIPNLWALERYS